MQSEKQDFEMVSHDLVMQYVNDAREIYSERLSKISAKSGSKEYKQQVRKIKAKALVNVLTALFLAALQQERGKYISIPMLIKAMPTVDEKKIRAAIKRVKETLLMVDGLVLANRPTVGYRLGIPKDMPLEAMKGCFCAMADLIQSLKVASFSKYDQANFLPAELNLIEINTEAARNSLRPLTELESEARGTEIYSEYQEHVSRLKKAIEDLG